MNRINTKSTRTTGAANAAATATVAAAPIDRRWRVHKVTASYSGAPTGGVLQILSGATVLWEADVDLRRVVESFVDAPLRCNPAETVSAVLSAGGAAVVGKVNLLVSLEQ